MITGDSAEYELLTEGVQMSAHVAGMLVEVGLRAGMGTKVIIDAAIGCRPGSTVLSIDPFGSIPYVGREHVGPIRLDYTNDMYQQAMADMSAYVLGKNVQWIPFKMTDQRFMYTHADGVEVYELEVSLVTKYAFVHLDGPHHFEAVTNEAEFFCTTMDAGGVVVVDDCTIDFIDIEPVNAYFETLGLKLVKQGMKKNIYQKVK